MTLEATGPNAEQIKYWNETAGPKWVTLQQFIDRQIRALGLLGIERAQVAAGEHVLDVGCGCGDTTLEIAKRVGATGSVTGLDISTPMLEQARAAASAAGRSNVTFENADAQTAALPRGRYDLLFSRFGVMFFLDPPAAFTNLRSALKPGARLTFVCWRPVQENPWMFVPVMAAAQHIQLPPPPGPDAPGPFAFGDTERVRTILASAGFNDIAFEAVTQKIDVGGGLGMDRAVDFLLQMGPTGNAMREAAVGSDLLEKVTAAVRDALTPYQTSDGIRLDAAVWIVTAKNP